MTYRPLSTAAAIARRGFGIIVQEATQRLYRALDDRIKSPRDPEAIRRHKAAAREEQRFGNAEHFGMRLSRMTLSVPDVSSQKFVLPQRATARAGHARGNAPRTRTTGRNTTKSAAGDSGDPDPERPHAQYPATTGLDAASFGGAAA